MKTTLNALFVLYPLLGFSQIINSNEITVAEFYDGKVKTVEVNGAKVTGQFRLYPFFWNKKETGWTYENNGEKTAEKLNAIFFNFGLTNTGNTLLNLNKLNLKNNNGWIFGLTFQHAFDKIYQVDEESNPHSLQTFTVGLNYQQDKFKNYNPSTKEISKSTPDQFILKFGYSKYFFNYKKSAKYKYAVVPTLIGTVNLKDYNKTGLKNYLLNDNITAGEIIITDNSNFDGKYGIINNNLKSAKISFSTPIVPEKFISFLPVISPIPHISYEVTENDKPRLNAGIAIGFLASSLVGEKIEKDIEGDAYRTYNVPSYITIGIDWNYKNGQGSKPNIFIAGSIKFK